MRHHAPIFFGLPQQQGESTQHCFIKVLACSLMALVVVTGTKEALISCRFSHLQPFICRSAQRSIHTGMRDKRGPWCWASEITATRRAPKANAEPQMGAVFLNIPGTRSPGTLSQSTCSRTCRELMDTSTQIRLGSDSSFLSPLGAHKATHRARPVPKNITDDAHL